MLHLLATLTVVLSSSGSASAFAMHPKSMRGTALARLRVGMKASTLCVLSFPDCPGPCRTGACHPEEVATMTTKLSAWTPLGSACSLSRWPMGPPSCGSARCGTSRSSSSTSTGEAGSGQTRLTWTIGTNPSSCQRHFVARFTGLLGRDPTAREPPAPSRTLPAASAHP